MTAIAAYHATKVIHKINLAPSGWIESGKPITASLPAGSIIRHLDVQHAYPMLWYQFNHILEEVKKDHTFAFFSTGKEIPATANYIGSISILNGEYVWHLYELLPEISP